MECSEARHLIHLDVGDDLRCDEEAQLASHMDQCGECRAYHAGMSSAMKALLVLRDDSSESSGSSAEPRSVWPHVSRVIHQNRTTPAKARKFNLQVAALSVCSLSLAVVTIVQSLSNVQEPLEQPSYISSQTVSNPVNRPPFQAGDQGPPIPTSSDALPWQFPHAGINSPQSF